MRARSGGTSFSGIASCASATAYSGPDATNATVGGTCTDNAGKTASATSPGFKYEASTPAVSVALSRIADSNGWYNRPVTGTANGTSFSGIVSCSTPVTYSGPDDTAATVTGSCTDNAGKTTSVASAPFQYEASSPTATATPARTPDSNGWYNHAVAAAMSGSSFSGIASCAPSTYSGPDALNATVTGTCTDYAGKTATGTSTAFKYEASTPTMTLNLSRSADSNGWYNHPVGATVSGSSFSGIASCNGSTYSGPDAENATVTGGCTDNAGKSVIATSGAFPYEASDPTATVSLDRPPDDGGWYTSPVTATFSGSSFSGIASCAPPVKYSGPDATGATVSGSCTDKAGKTANAASTFMYDASGPIVSVTLSRPPDSGGWYTHDVSATVTGNAVSGIASCTGTSYAGPDASDATVTGTCTDKAGRVTTTPSAPFHYEASSPTASAVPSRAPDSNGWFSHAITAKLIGSSFSGIAACSPSTYSGPDSTKATVGGSCKDNAGKTVSATSAPFRYEASSPTVSVFPSRPPDSNGWYNHPITAAFSGSSFSGIASCTPATYVGPDSSTATVGGSCTDNAGKTVRATSVAFPYDASTPAFTVTAAPADGVVVLNWVTTDVDPLGSVRITRARAHHGAAPDVLVSAHRSAYVDRHVRNGVRYRYAVIATDVAGNVARESFVVTPGPRLLLPDRGAVVSAPPLLQWTPVRGATYYNIQLYRGGQKIFSAWPSRSSLQLSQQWTFDHRRHRLQAGSYRWYVWPGFGRRAAVRYGHKIGNSTFVFRPGLS